MNSKINQEKLSERKRRLRTAEPQRVSRCHRKGIENGAEKYFKNNGQNFPNLVKNKELTYPILTNLSRKNMKKTHLYTSQLDGLNRKIKKKNNESSQRKKH